MSELETQPTDSQAIRHCLVQILQYIGEDPNREGLRETPDRILRSWQELFAGYQQRPEDVLKVFEDGSCDEMVILKDIEFYSVCEHHWLPFFGSLSIGYLPHKKVIGVSKLARLAEIYTRRLQIQERLTAQIADALMDALEPKGVMVICEAQHLCMTARGVGKQHSKMITSAIRGSFLANPQAKQEFLSFLS